MQPNQPEPTEHTTPPVQEAQAYKRSPVTYLTGMNKMNANNRHSAVLEWSADNRIRLFVIDESSSQTAILDCAPSDIKRFSTGMGSANLILKSGQRFTVEFSSTVGNQLIAGAVASQFGVGGLAVATAIDKQAAETEAATDIEWWTQTLAKFGVHGLQSSAKTMYNINKVGWWVIGGMVGFTILLLLVAFVLFSLDAAGIG